MLTIIWQFLNIRKILFLRRFANLHLPFCPFFHVINKFASFVYKKKAMLSGISWWHCLLRHIFICYFQLLSVCTSDNLNPSVFQQLANLSDSTALMSFYLCNRKDRTSKKGYFLRKLLLSDRQVSWLTDFLMSFRKFSEFSKFAASPSRTSVQWLFWSFVCIQWPQPFRHFTWFPLIRLRLSVRSLFTF